MITLKEWLDELSLDKPKDCYDTFDGFWVSKHSLPLVINLKYYYQFNFINMINERGNHYHYFMVLEDDTVCEPIVDVGVVLIPSNVKIVRSNNPEAALLHSRGILTTFEEFCLYGGIPYWKVIGLKSKQSLRNINTIRDFVNKDMLRLFNISKSTLNIVGQEVTITTTKNATKYLAESEIYRTDKGGRYLSFDEAEEQADHYLYHGNVSTHFYLKEDLNSAKHLNKKYPFINTTKITRGNLREYLRGSIVPGFWCIDDKVIHSLNLTHLLQRLLNIFGYKHGVFNELFGKGWEERSVNYLGTNPWVLLAEKLQLDLGN